MNAIFYSEYAYYGKYIFTINERIDGQNINRVVYIPDFFCATSGFNQTFEWLEYQLHYRHDFDVYS